MHLPSPTALLHDLRALRLRLTAAALRAAPSEAQRMLVITMFIGLTCGLVAVLFHEAIRVAEDQLISRGFSASGYWWIGFTILIPTLGGITAGVLLQYVFPNARGSGIPQVKASYAGKAGRVRLRDAAGKFVLSAIQIGSGASLGREGPTVQICAGVASALGRLARLSPEAQRKLIPVGAAAGIAAAFNAPIAAVTFTIEEIIGKLDDTLLSGVIIAAALAAVIERSILGAHPVFDVPGHYGLDDARSLLFYALLGVAAAATSVAFNDLLLRLRVRFQAMKVIPPWARPGIGGFVTGVLAVVVFLTVGARGVTGGGYDTLRLALSGGLGVKVMVVLCIVKLLATCFSYSSGGAGGIFAPVLFIGAMLGGAFGWLDVHLFHHPEKTAGAFALVGMGAVFSGAIRAPMTSVLIIVEMTSGYDLILPLMIANMSAYLLARRYRPDTIYESLLAQDGISVEELEPGEKLHRMEIGALASQGREFLSYVLRASAAEIVLLENAPAWQVVFPVTDDEGKLAGIITHHELRVVTAEPELLRITNAADLMRSATLVHVTDSVRFAFDTMLAEGLRQLPVVDADGRVVGFIDEGAIAQVLMPTPPKSSHNFTPSGRHKAVDPKKTTRP